MTEVGVIQTLEKKWADFDLDDEPIAFDSKTKWADIDEAEELVDNKSAGFTSYENGLKIVTKYSENLKKQPIKITKKIKEVIINKKLNKEIYSRNNLKPFNVEILKAPPNEPLDVINIEVPKNNPLDFLKDTEYDYLFNEQTNKAAKDLKSRFKLLKDEENDENKADDAYKNSSRRDGLNYMSHENRNKECTVRVTNLSEDVNETELSNLFGKAGTIIRMFLAKHKETQNSKGFAFITYSNRDEAKKAIEKLNRHGFENLLLNVEWAKPSTR